MAHWPILIVDDEPDVLSISKLAMKNFTVFGLPLKLYTAESKADAVKLLNSTLAMQGQSSPLAIAVIDVVMESDEAGLELCDYFRNSQHNHMTQLFIRTGQPGTAPERKVIDLYDINGYFTKPEITEDKLYSLVKSGVRQYYSAKGSLNIAEFTNKLIAVSNSRESMKQFIQSVWESAGRDEDGRESLGLEGKHYTFVNGEGIGGTLNESEAEVLRNRLEKLSGVSLGPAGDKYVSDDNHFKLMKIAAGQGKAEVYYVIKGHFATPDVALMTYHAFWSSFARLWHSTVPK